MCFLINFRCIDRLQCEFLVTLPRSPGLFIPAEGFFPNRWRAWWMRKSWSWCLARNFIHTTGQFGLFLSSHDGIFVFQRILSNPSPDHSRLMKDFTYDMTLAVENFRCQNRPFPWGGSCTGFWVGFLSKAKFTIDVAAPALCMTDSTSVIAHSACCVNQETLKWNCLQTWRL